MQARDTTSGGAMYRQAMRQAALNSMNMSKGEVRSYSITRALRQAAYGEALQGYEAEVDAEVTRQFGDRKSANSVRIPTGIPLTRDLTAGTASAGGYLVGTDNLGGSFIDVLRNRLVTVAMGATLLPNLRGNVTIPKQTGAATAVWLATEASTITESQQTLGQISMTPKNVGGYTEVTRQLLLQSIPAADAMVMNDLAKVIGLAVDLAAMSGSGASGEPTGIINTAGIGSVSGTSLAYAGLLEFQSDLGNALIDSKRVGYVTTPAVGALLLQRQRFTSTDSPLWEGNLLEGKISGFRAMTSNGVPSAKMIFGNWEDLLIGEWGVLEIETNPFANFQGGIIGIRAIQSVDIAIRVAQSFSVASAIT